MQKIMDYNSFSFNSYSNGFSLSWIAGEGYYRRKLKGLDLTEWEQFLNTLSEDERALLPGRRRSEPY